MSKKEAAVNEIMVRVDRKIGDKGFGFLYSEHDGRRYFLHISVLVESGFRQEDLRTDASLVIDAKKEDQGWKVNKIHSIGDSVNGVNAGDRVVGRVKWFDWSEDKCFGFVVVDGLHDVFLHGSELASMPPKDAVSVGTGAVLQFTLKSTKKGWAATDVSFADSVSDVEMKKQA